MYVARPTLAHMTYGMRRNKFTALYIFIFEFLLF